MESARTPAAARARNGVGGLLALALTCLGASPAAAAPELASVILHQDAVWEGRVEVGGQVTVPGGVTLLLRPGTEVRFAARPGAEPADKARLVVRGALVAEGTPERPIRFLSAAPEPQPGDWGGLVIEDTRGRTSRLRHCRIEHADEGLRVRAASAVVENSVLTRNRTGFVGLRHGDGGLFATEVSDNATGLFFRQSTGLRVEECRILRNREGGIVCSYGSAPALVGNEIGENAVGGIACVQGSSPSIEANEIRGHEYGVHVDLKSNPLVFGNRIHGNGTGLWVAKLSNPAVVQNAVTGNGVGIFCDHSAYPRVHDNDLSGNARFAMALGDHQSIHVEQRIPYRDLGQFHPEAPARLQTLPPRTRKFTAFSGSSLGLLDARGNWWGHEPTAEMAASGAEGNVGAIEDVWDHPEVTYEGRQYPRDRVVFDPWLDAPPLPPDRPLSGLVQLRGKATLGDGLAPEVRVHAYDAASGGFRGEGLSYSSPTGPDGAFSLRLAPGRYFLVAKGTASPFPSSDPEPGELFGYYGGNPVTLGAGAAREVNVRLGPRRPVAVLPGEAPGPAALEGAVLGPKGPVEGARIMLYPQGAAGFRGPDVFGPHGALPGGTDPQGRFRIEAPPGDYHLVAVSRNGDGHLGPLEVGDLFGYFDGNPISLRSADVWTVTVHVVEKHRDPGAQDEPGIGVTGLRGVVRDEDGRVPAGVYAFASADPGQLVGGAPPLRSRPVGDDGSFFLGLPAGGTYFVGARSGYGGPPLPGQWHGLHGGEAPLAVAVEEGSIRDGIEVLVHPME